MESWRLSALWTAQTARTAELTLVLALNGLVASRESLDELLSSDETRHDTLVVTEEEEALFASKAKSAFTSLAKRQRRKRTVVAVAVMAEIKRVPVSPRY